MYEDITPETIKAEILDEITTDIDTREGSYTADLAAPLALELWKMYDALNALIPIAYIDETSGDYIDKRCAEIGLTRKDGAKAAVVLTFTGTDGTVIPKGSLFLTRTGLGFTADTDVTVSSGTATVTATAEKTGDAYNTAAGTITVIYRSRAGLRTVTNDKAATGGFDSETDASLVARYYDALGQCATSGNIFDYEQWALETAGVGGVKVTPLAWGPGTVGVLIVGPDMEPVTVDVVNACAAHIEEYRPIGAEVAVESAAGVQIDVVAAVTLEDGYTASDVQASFRASLDAYLKSISFKKHTIPYSQIVYLLMGTDGATDYSTLTVNGGTDAVVLTSKQVPVIGTVVVG